MDRRGQLDEGQKVTFDELNQEASTSILKHLDDNDEKQLELQCRILHNLTTMQVAFPCTLRVAAEHFTKLHDKELMLEKKLENSFNRAEAQKDKSLKKACAKLRSNIVPPLQHTTTTTTCADGTNYTTYITDPKEVDRIVRETWNKIRRGRIDDEKHIMHSFHNKYAGHLHKAREHKLSKIT